MHNQYAQYVCQHYVEETEPVPLRRALSISSAHNEEGANNTSSMTPWHQFEFAFSFN